MRRLALPLVVLGLSLAPRAQSPDGDGFSFDAAWPDVAAEFRGGCETRGVVGAALMFVEGAEIRAFEAFGMADRDAGRAVDRDTIFHWASITKTFTAIAFVQLRDRERVTLGGSVCELVPEFRDVHDPFGAIADVTWRHLLSHSSGLRAPTWPWGGDESWHPYEPRSFAQLAAMMPYTEIRFAPGSQYGYSNPGIVLVGRAIELVSGDDYEVYMAKNVLSPLGMRHGYFDVTPYHLRRFRSHGYAREGDAIRDLGADFDTGVTVSNGGLNAPLTDMAKYLAFLLGAVEEDSDAAAVLARESLEEMWRPVVSTGGDDDEHVGLGFFVRERNGHRLVTHTGSQHGYHSFFYVHPASNTAAVAVFNTDSGAPLVPRLRELCFDRLSAPMAPR